MGTIRDRSTTDSDICVSGAEAAVSAPPSTLRQQSRVSASKSCAGALVAALTVITSSMSAVAADLPRLWLSWSDNLLVIHGNHLPGRRIEVWYLEAYCRAGSTDRDWRETVVPHRTRLRSQSPDGRRLRLRCRVEDGLVVDHTITASDDEINFSVTAHNPTSHRSEVHWAQPCVRVDRFTGRGQDDYLAKCFIFLNGRLTRLPCRPWATKARYTPGQVWRAPGISPDDVNPRPLSPLIPDPPLIGCFSADERLLLATAWQPYQELFQGVIVCLHSDFRLGGLEPGQTRHIRGKIYVLPADVDRLLDRYQRDFSSGTDVDREPGTAID